MRYHRNLTNNAVTERIPFAEVSEDKRFRLRVPKAKKVFIISLNQDDFEGNTVFDLNEKKFVVFEEILKEELQA